MSSLSPTTRRVPLHQAISELGGACIHALWTLRYADQEFHRAAKTRLFACAFRVMLLLLNDPEVDRD